MICRVILVLAVLLALPVTVHGQSARGGAPPTVPGAEWSISIDARCTQAAGGSPACRTLMGSAGRLTGRMSIRPNANASALTFTATYTRTRPALPRGVARARPTALCAFGLGADRQRILPGSPPGYYQVCTTTVHGHMMLRAGAMAHFGQRLHVPQLAHLRDFWITDETASVPAASISHRVDPLGRGHYPIDTRFPAAGDGVHTYDANIYLGMLGVPGYPMQAAGPLDGISLTVTVSQEPLAGGRSPNTATPWVVRRVLDVRGVRGLCATHPSAHFVASVRGYLATTGLQGPAGGWVGRLFSKPDPHAFFAGDTQPFVQVWGTIRWSIPANHLVTVHGTLACDAAAQRANLPGWQASIRPDRVISSGTASPRAEATVAPPSATTICTASRIPNVLLVSRYNRLPMNAPTPYSSPLHRVVRAKAIVERLYATVCGLSPVDLTPPPSCPANLGIGYTLVFRHNAGGVLQTTAQATGCQWLLVGDSRPTGPVYWLTPRFWKFLGLALRTKPRLLHAA